MIRGIDGLLRSDVSMQFANHELEWLYQVRCSIKSPHQLYEYGVENLELSPLSISD